MQEPAGDRGLALSGRPMRDPPDDKAPAWSPDGTRIAFSRTSANYLEEIYVMNADGSSLTSRLP